MAAVLSLLLGCLAPPAEPTLEQVLAELTAAERALLLATAAQPGPEGEEALAWGLRLDAAAFLPLAAGRSLSPEVARLVEAAGGPRFDPQQGVVARYPAGAEVPPALRGARRDLLPWIGEALEATWIEAVDWPRVGEASMLRWRWVAQAPAFGLDLPERPPPQDRPAWTAGPPVVPGLPEEVAIGEWVEAGLSALDPYSRVVWPVEAPALRLALEGRRIDPGVVLEVQEGRLLVVDLVPEGPAWSSNLHQGDELLAIDGVAPADLVAAQSALAGSEGERRRLQVRRGEGVQEVVVPLASWEEASVVGWQRTAGGWALEPAPGVAYLRIRSFKPGTDEQLDALVGEGAWASVILDLRGNPGGDVSAAANVVDRFVAEGKVARLVGRGAPPDAPAVDPASGETIYAWNDALPGHPLEAARALVVLVDEETASSAELVAGSLRQRRGAWLVGAPTFGKAQLQQVVASPDGAAELVVTHLLLAGPGAGGPPPGEGWPVDHPLRLGPAARWQVAALRRRAEGGVVHADGSPMTPRVPRPREGLPVLPADPGVALALQLLASGAHAGGGEGGR